MTLNLNNNGKSIIPTAAYKLPIDENWKVEIPADLREKLNLKKNEMIDIYFDLVDEEIQDNFNALLDALAHDGILISIPLNQRM